MWERLKPTTTSLTEPRKKLLGGKRGQTERRRLAAEPLNILRDKRRYCTRVRCEQEDIKKEHSENKIKISLELKSQGHEWETQ